MASTQWGFAAPLVLVLAALGGCEGAAQTDDAGVSVREAADNGVSLNSARINGWHLNGWHLNGGELNGWHLNGWHLNGGELNNVSLIGTLFHGEVLVDGVPQPRTGLQFIGSELSLVRAGTTYKLRIDDIYEDPAQPGGGVFFYAVSLLLPGQSTWTSLCRDGEGQPIEAIPLANAWDMETGARIDAPGFVTLACRGAVLAKCVEWGYRPWATATSCDAMGMNCVQVSLRDHHQACTRMARADYCGDGTPHTLDGTPIDVYDGLSPSLQTRATSGLPHWKPEAEWGPDGALCIGKALRLSMLDELGVADEAPPCLDALDGPKDCGELPTGGLARLANAYCPGWIDDPQKCAPVNDDTKKKQKDKKEKKPKPSKGK